MYCAFICVNVVKSINGTWPVHICMLVYFYFGENLFVLKTFRVRRGGCICKSRSFWSKLISSRDFLRLGLKNIAKLSNLCCLPNWKWNPHIYSIAAELQGSYYSSALLSGYTHRLRIDFINIFHSLTWPQLHMRHVGPLWTWVQLHMIKWALLNVLKNMHCP